MWAKHKQHGFTIVELLIVIVVIGILAAITIVAYNGIQGRARAAAQMSVLSSAAKAAQMALTLNGSYPLASTLPTNSGINLTITGSVATETFCITATGPSYNPKNVIQSGAIADGPCDGQSGGANYCPESLVTTIDGYYCTGTYGSAAGQSSGTIRLDANAAEVPPGAPAASVGRQNGRDSNNGAAFTIVGGESYCVSGWATTVSSTVGHTVGLQITGPSLATQWLGVNYLMPSTATNTWLKMTGCITIPSGYTSGRFWTQNNGAWGSTADVAWYQTALTLTKQ